MRSCSNFNEGHISVSLGLDDGREYISTELYTIFVFVFLFL